MSVCCPHHLKYKCFWLNPKRRSSEMLTYQWGKTGNGLHMGNCWWQTVWLRCRWDQVCCKSAEGDSVWNSIKAYTYIYIKVYIYVLNNHERLLRHTRVSPRGITTSQPHSTFNVSTMAKTRSSAWCKTWWNNQTEELKHLQIYSGIFGFFHLLIKHKEQCCHIRPGHQCEKVWVNWSKTSDNWHGATCNVIT